jgi:hypothetical protein
MSTVKEANSQVGGADIVTLDFDGTDFDLTESPDTEINIVVNNSGIDHDATTNFVANEHIDWTSASANFSTSGTVGGGAGTFTSLSITDGNITNVADIALDSITADDGTGPIVVNDDMRFIDSEELLLGTGSDLELFHNGTDSYIQNNTGDIVVENDALNQDIIFKVNVANVDTNAFQITGADGTCTATYMIVTGWLSSELYSAGGQDGMTQDIVLAVGDTLNFYGGLLVGYTPAA